MECDHEIYKVVNESLKKKLMKYEQQLEKKVIELARYKTRVDETNTLVQNVEWEYQQVISALNEECTSERAEKEDLQYRWTFNVDYHLRIFTT